MRQPMPHRISILLRFMLMCAGLLSPLSADELVKDPFSDSDAGPLIDNATKQSEGWRGPWRGEGQADIVTYKDDNSGCGLLQPGTILARQFAAQRLRSDAEDGKTLYFTFRWRANGSPAGFWYGLADNTAEPIATTKPAVFVGFDAANKLFIGCHQDGLPYRLATGETIAPNSGGSAYLSIQAKDQGLRVRFKVLIKSENDKTTDLHATWADHRAADAFTTVAWNTLVVQANGTGMVLDQITITTRSLDFDLFGYLRPHPTEFPIPVGDAVALHPLSASNLSEPPAVAAPQTETATPAQQQTPPEQPANEPEPAEATPEQPEQQPKPNEPADLPVSTSFSPLTLGLIILALAAIVAAILIYTSMRGDQQLMAGLNSDEDASKTGNRLRQRRTGSSNDRNPRRR